MISRIFFKREGLHVCFDSRVLLVVRTQSLSFAAQVFFQAFSLFRFQIEVVNIAMFIVAFHYSDSAIDCALEI